MRTLLNVTKIFGIFNPACDGVCKALSFGFAQNIFTGALPLEKRNVPRTAGSSTDREIEKGLAAKTKPF
jgi:hypothetical protein